MNLHMKLERIDVLLLSLPVQGYEVALFSLRASFFHKICIFPHIDLVYVLLDLYLSNCVFDTGVNYV
jgi:hypothetical protein